MKTSKLLKPIVGKASAAVVASAMMAGSSFALTVSGTTYTVNGTQNLSQDVSLRNGGVIQSGSSPAVLNLTGFGNHYDDMRSGTVNDVNLSGSNARFEKTTSGTLTLNSNNTYGGRTDIERGTLILGAGYGDVLPTGTDVTLSGTSTLNISGNNQTIQSLSLTQSSRIVDTVGGGELNITGTATLQSGTISAVIGSAAGVVKSGSSSSRVVLNATNTYTASTTVQSGTLRLGVVDAIASSTNVIVNGGVLELYGNDQTFLAVSGTGGRINVGSATLTVGGANADTTFGGRFSGETGTIVKTGTGDLTLTGSNSFTGLLRIEDGQVSIGDDERLDNDMALEIDGENASFNTNTYRERVGSISLRNGAIVGSGTLSTNNYIDLENGTVDAVLGGNANLYKYTNGTVVLNNENTYTGFTYIDEGILKAGTNNIFSSSAGVYVGAEVMINLAPDDEPIIPGTWDIAGTEQTVNNLELTGGLIDDSVGGGSITSLHTVMLQSGTVNAVLSGSNGVSKYDGLADFSYVLLTGENTYTGNTVVNGGFLQIGDGVTGSISAESTVIVFGTSSALALNLADGSTFSNDVYLTGSGAFGAIQDGNLEISSVISGTGNFYQVGAGRTVLTGDSDFAGNTYVQYGDLIIEGSVQSDAIVGYYGVLGGNGYIGGSVYSEGIISPGTSIGTLTIGHDLYLDSSSTLYIEVKNTKSYDRVVVGGTATLGGTLRIASVSKGGKKDGDKFTILTADEGVEGKFAKVKTSGVQTLAGFDVNYHADSVVLEYVEETFLDYAKANNLTDNQKAIAKALDRANKRGKLGSLLNTLYSLDVDDVGSVLALLSPEQISQIYQIGFANAQTQYNNLDRRLSDVRDGAIGFSTNGLALSNSRGTLNYDGMPITNSRDGLTLAGWDGKSVVGKQTVAPVVEQSRWGFFATGQGEWADVETTAQARGSEFRTGGFTLGVDYRVSDNFVVGLAGGYANTGSKLYNDGKIELNSGRGSVYASLFGSGFYLNTQVGGAYNSYDTKRSTVGGKAKGSTEGGEFNSLIGGGYDYRIGGFSIGPVASLQYTYLGLNGYQETGSDANLQYGSQSQDSLKSSLGARVAYAWNVGGVVIKPEVRAQWQHEFLDSTAAVESSFVGAGSSFTVNGPNIGRDSLLLDAGVSVQFNPAVSVFAYYTGEIGRTNYSSNAVNGGFRINF